MDGVPGWLPGHPCPCPEESCDAVAFKLNRFGHGSRVCRCRVCIGRRANSAGHRKQAKVLKDMAVASGRRMDRAPSNEEFARFPWFAIEVKSGTQVPMGVRGSVVERWERQVKNAAEGTHPAWALVFVFPDGRRRFYCDYDDMLRYLAEHPDA